MKNIKKVLLIFLVIPVILSGQTYFSKSFALDTGNDSNTGANIQPYEDGYLILGGRVNDFGIEYAGLAKVDPGGNPEWTKTYYLENQETPPDGGLNMVIGDSSIYIGCQFYNNNITQLDIQLLCIDKITHDTLWTKVYQRQFNDYILQILETADDGLVMITSARTATTPGINQLRLIKTDKSGNLIWEKFYSDFKLYSPWQSCIATDGNILVAYAAKEVGSIYYFGVLTKIDLEGQVLWTRKFNESNSGDKPKAAMLNNGDIAFAWTADTFAVNLSPFPPAIYILDSSGNIKARRIIYTQALNSIFSLRVLPGGDILGVGSTIGPSANSFSVGGWLFRMSPEGELLWHHAITDKRYGIAELFDGIGTPDGGILATGNITTKDNPEQILVWMLKINGNGCYENLCDSILYITPSSEPQLVSHPYRLYPNPVTDVIHIEGMTGDDEQKIHIFNITGQLILSNHAPQTNYLDVAHLQPGTYFLRITLKNNLSTTLKFTKL